MTCKLCANTHQTTHINLPMSNLVCATMVERIIQKERCIYLYLHILPLDIDIGQSIYDSLDLVNQIIVY